MSGAKAASDALTLEQLRLLVAVADVGSFTKAAKRLGRAQSGVSQSMAALEGLLGVRVWDRSERSVQLTDPGRAVVAAARRVLAEVDHLREVAAAANDRRASRLSLCVDALFPPRALVDLATSMQRAFPGLELAVDTDTLGSVARRVEEREFDLGIAGPLATSEALERVAVGEVRLVPIAERGHPLAALRGPISLAAARRETQIVLSERAARGSPDQGVIGERTWRVADLATKLELIRGGLGWGNLPTHLVADELRRGALAELAIEAWSPDEHRLPLALVFRPAQRRRPIVRWAVAQLPSLCGAWGVGLRERHTHHGG